jgi:hypothetical protein
MDRGQDEKSAVIDHQAQTAVALGPGPTDPLIPVFEMLGGGMEEQQPQPSPLGIHGGVKDPFANRFEAAPIMALLEQFLKVTLRVRLGHEHDFDLSKTRRSSMGNRPNRRFGAFHAAEDRKLARSCSAKSALTTLSMPPATLMHTRWRQRDGARPHGPFGGSSSFTVQDFRCQAEMPPASARADSRPTTSVTSDPNF